jgi:hypothetical protein
VSENYNFGVDYSQFLTEVTPYASGVPEFVAINAVRNAVIEFCRKTHYWQEDLDPASGTAKVPNYPVDTPPNTVLVDIVGAWYNGTLLVPKSIDELSQIYRTLDWRTIDGNPAYYTRVIEPEIILVPYPTASLPNALTMRVALAPTRNSTYVDSALYEHYVEEIGFGARARLYSMTGQPFANDADAKTYALKFRVAMDKARIRTSKSNTRGSQRVEFVRTV